MKAVAVAALLASSVASAAFAQDVPALGVHHVTLGAGVTWSGGYGAGDATARLRGNGTGPTAPPFDWFRAATRVTAAIAPEVHVGFAFTPVLAVDGGIRYARPRIAIAISGDAEAPRQQLPGEQIEQYEIGAGATWQVPYAVRGKLAPFVSGGAAYLRQLHEDRTLAETGWVYYAGGGARYWLYGGRGDGRAAGVRMDARVNLRTQGIDFEDKMRAYPTLTVSLFIGL